MKQDSFGVQLYMTNKNFIDLGSDMVPYASEGSRKTRFIYDRKSLGNTHTQTQTQTQYKSLDEQRSGACCELTETLQMCFSPAFITRTIFFFSCRRLSRPVHHSHSFSQSLKIHSWAY